MILSPEEKIKEYTKRGWWGTETIIDLIYEKAKARPDREAFVDAYNKKDLVGTEPKRMTYAEIIDAVDRLALTFLELGVKRDDIILAQLPNIVELPITMFAAARIGAVISPIPVQWRSHEISKAIELVKPTIFVTAITFHGFDHLGMARELASGSKSIKKVIAVGAGDAADAIPFEEILGKPLDEASRKSLEGKGSGANDIFTICWTSGTEADSKAVPRSHNHWLAISRAAVESFLPDAECIYLSLFPTINMAGIGAVLVPWVITGGTMVFHHPFDMGVFLRQVVEEKIYYTLAPPVLLDALAMVPQWKEMDKSNLKVIGSGSAPLSTWMVKTYQEDFNISIVNFFASNEGLALYSSSADIPSPEDRATFFPRFGGEGLTWGAKAVEGIKSRLVDPQTEEEITEPDIVGELRFDGPTVFPGYYKQPELTKKAFDEKGFYCTGDLFSIAGEKKDKYRFHGRYKDLIIRGGMNISPEEIEAIVVAHPKVAEVAAVGYPDEKIGERVCVVVVPAPEQTITLEEIVDFVKEKNIAKYKYPEVLEVVDVLPRNPLNKVTKSKIREMLAEKDSKSK